MKVSNTTHCLICESVKTYHFDRLYCFNDYVHSYLYSKYTKPNNYYLSFINKNNFSSNFLKQNNIFYIKGCNSVELLLTSFEFNKNILIFKQLFNHLKTYLILE